MGVPEVRWARTPLNALAREQALGMLSATERERFETSTAQSRESYLAGRLLLRRLAAELTAVEPAAVTLSAVCPDCGGPHGRPVIGGSSLNLSLSHTQDLVVVAASWGAPVGIDAESSAQTVDALAAIKSLTGDASLLHWTRVEAVLKADGRGLRVDPASVEITEIDGEVRGRVIDRPETYAVTEADLPGATVSIAVLVSAPQ